MFNVHAYLDTGEKQQAAFRRFMRHLPAKGDTIRLNEKTYVIVTEVIWCIDEDDRDGQRVNLRLEKEK